MNSLIMKVIKVLVINYKNNYKTIIIIYKTNILLIYLFYLKLLSLQINFEKQNDSFCLGNCIAFSLQITNLL